MSCMCFRRVARVRSVEMVARSAAIESENRARRRGFQNGSYDNDGGGRQFQHVDHALGFTGAVRPRPRGRPPPIAETATGASLLYEVVIPINDEAGLSLKACADSQSATPVRLERGSFSFAATGMAARFHLSVSHGGNRPDVPTALGLIERACSHEADGTSGAPLRLPAGRRRPGLPGASSSDGGRGMVAVAAQRRGSLPLRWHGPRTVTRN